MKDNLRINLQIQESKAPNKNICSININQNKNVTEF